MVPGAVVVVIVVPEVSASRAAREIRRGSVDLWMNNIYRCSCGHKWPLYARGIPGDKLPLLGAVCGQGAVPSLAGKYSEFSWQAAKCRPQLHHVANR